MIHRLFKHPEKYRLFQAVRLLEIAARHAGGKRARRSGLAADPREEAVRFRGQLTLAFPGAEVAALHPAEGARPPTLVTPVMSAAGPTSPLPAQYAAMALRAMRAKSTGLRDFLDIFNHRLLILFQAAWAKYRLPIAYERRGGDGRDGTTELLRALIGIGSRGLDGRHAIGDEILLHYAGTLARRGTSAVDLQQILSDQLGRPVRIAQFVGDWLAIPRDEQTCLSGLGTATRGFARLGVDAVVGERVWDIESSFRIEVGPLSYAEFERFMPGGPDLGRLRELVRFSAGMDRAFTVRPVLHRDEVPKPSLGGGTRLGWNSWLVSTPLLREGDEVVF